MCVFGRRQPTMPAPQVIATPNNAEATRRSSMEARMRRMRAGAAANILTSPAGVPGGGSATMGGTS